MSDPAWAHTPYPRARPGVAHASVPGVPLSCNLGRFSQSVHARNVARSSSSMRCDLDSAKPGAESWRDHCQARVLTRDRSGVSSAFRQPRTGCLVVAFSTCPALLQTAVSRALPWWIGRTTAVAPVRIFRERLGASRVRSLARRYRALDPPGALPMASAITGATALSTRMYSKHGKATSIVAFRDNDAGNDECAHASVHLVHLLVQPEASASVNPGATWAGVLWCGPGVQKHPARHHSAVIPAHPRGRAPHTATVSSTGFRVLPGCRTPS